MSPSRRKGLLIAGFIGLALGVFALGYGVWSLGVTNVTASHAEKARVRVLQRQLPTTTATVPTTTMPDLGHDLGIIKIPKMHLSAPIVEGTRTEDLKHGVGHAPATQGPGQLGNFALAGHRTTYAHPFWSINKLTTGDKIEIITAAGKYTYVVTRHWIVKPNTISVYSSHGLSSGRWLTMTSCNPRYSARQRYVVRAELED